MYRTHAFRFGTMWPSVCTFSYPSPRHWIEGLCQSNKFFSRQGASKYAHQRKGLFAD
jgi:hypothetical protein